jgi:hypothetical protein
MGKTLRFPQAPPGPPAHDAAPPERTLWQIIQLLIRVKPSALLALKGVAVQFVPAPYRTTLGDGHADTPLPRPGGPKARPPQDPAAEDARLREAIALVTKVRAPRSAAADRVLRQCLAELRQRRRAVRKAAR